MDNIE
jgi:hypothetical protein